MTVIRIDDEVMHELRKHAVKLDLVFSNPNQVLRRILGLDRRHNQEPRVQPISPTLVSTQRLDTPLPGKSQSPIRRVTGKRLLREHQDLPQDMRPYADRDGIFYEWPKSFPAILFDDGGFVIFKTEDSMVNAGLYLTAYTDTRLVSVPQGISSMPGYVRCGHNHRSGLSQ